MQCTDVQTSKTVNYKYVAHKHGDEVMGNLLRITDMEYRTAKSETILKVVGRNERGKRQSIEVMGVEPYVFIPETESSPGIIDEQDRRCTGVETGYESFDGVPLKKITLRHPKDVKGTCGHDHCSDEALGDIYPELYEGDIPFIRRAAIDYGLSGYIEVPQQDTVHIDDIKTNIDTTNRNSIEPRIFMADIEVMPPDGGESFDEFRDNATKEVTAITLYDTHTEEYIALVSDGEGLVDAVEVKKHLTEHWKDHDNAEKYIDADIRLERVEDEIVLLNRFIEIIEKRRPDLLSGWNWINFDHEYLWNRMRKLDDVNEHRMSDIGTVGGFRTTQIIDGLPGFDMMNSFVNKMTFSEWRSKSLDFVASEELDVGKIEDVSVGKAYEQQRSRFLAYNIIDTQLLVGLDDKNGIHEFFYQLADLCSVQIYDAMHEMRLVDGFLMSLRDDDEILPSAGKKEMESIPGGLVLKPSHGIFEWVSVFDLKSLYPSVFITLNASPETMTYDPNEADLICPGMPEKEANVPGDTITEADISWEFGEPGNGPQNGNAVGFTTDEEGFIPKYLKLLFDNRAEMKAKRDEFDPDDPQYEVYDNRQRAIKVVMNSMYGVLTSPYARLASEDLGAAITAGGRYTLWRGGEIAEDDGFDVKYGDTDSIMISLVEDDESPDELTPIDVKERGDSIEAEINDAMNDVIADFGLSKGAVHPFISQSDLHGTDRHCLWWEHEKLYRRFIQAGSKKRYAGLPVWKEGKWYISDKNNAEIVDAKDMKPDVTGFETERADVPIVTERAQSTVLSLLLAGCEFEDISGYVSEEVRRVKEIDLPVHQIAEPSVINKPLEEYPNMRVKRGCLYANRHLDYDWREGDDPWLFSIARTPSMMADTDVLAVEWGEGPPEDFEIDTARIIEKKIRDPIEPLLDVVQWSFEELKTGRQVQAVEIGSDGDTSNPFAGNDGPINNPFADSNNVDDDDDDDMEQQDALSGW